MIQPPTDLRILHVEDDAPDALLVEFALRKEGLSFTLTRLDREEDFVRALRSGCPDLILSDFSMPGFSGTTALARARELCPEVPFIFVSGHIGEDRAIESLKNGATDYVLKDRLSRLGPVVRRALVEAADRKARRNAQASLADSRAETHLILEKALDAVVTMSTGGLVTGWNPQAERTFGWSRAEALGRPLGELIIPPAYRAAHREGLERYARMGEGPVLDRRIELPGLHKEGFEVPVELTVIPIRGAAGTFFAAFLRDVGRRNRAARRLAVEHAVTRILADSPDLGIAIPRILRAITEGLSWNVGQFWKVDPGESVLRVVSSWPTPDEKDSEFLRVNRSMTLKKGIGLPGEVWRKGEAVWVADLERAGEYPWAGLTDRSGIRGAFAFPVVDGPEMLGVIECFHQEARPPDGELLPLAEAIGREVGQFRRRKYAEETLRSRYETLERRLQERTRQHSDLTRELDTFSTSIAHDLRAPLRALRGFSDILIQERSALKPAEVETYLGYIGQAAERMDALVEDLLDYSRLSRVEIPLETVDLGREVEELLLGMASEIREREGKVRVEAPLHRARAHRRTLRQVLMNLISNAMKFVAPGVLPRVDIRTEERGERIRLWVDDNGIGIDPAQHERIFKPFERLQTEFEYPGTGIGLAIVRKGMERMGGGSGVESEPGRGSHFWIDLQKPDA